MKNRHYCVTGIFIILAFTACSPRSGEEFSRAEGAFSLTSSVFRDQAPIPEKYTCRGNNLSTPLAWTGAPDGTKSFAIIMDDPDARPVVGYTWIHWVAYNIPATVKRIPEAMATSDSAKLPEGESFTQGLTSWKKPGYGGPCPPKGTGVHRYIFTLYALKSGPELPAGLTKEKLLKVMEGSILAETKLTGTYTKD